MTMDTLLDHDNSRTAARVLDYRAPWLEAKYVQTGLAESSEHAAALFLELKRFLFLAAAEGGKIPMPSSLIDAAWHQFIQHTEQYSAFCTAMWGRFQHHVPRPADLADGDTTDEHGQPLSVDAFVTAYERHFGPPPDCWHNERCLTQHATLVHPNLRPLSVASTPRAATLLRGAASPQLVCSVSPRAEPALRFIAAHRRFMVRELPGLRGPEEQLGLVRPLVACNILELAP